MADALVLAINCGSSSVKYRLYRGERPIRTGSIDGIGTAAPRWQRDANPAAPLATATTSADAIDHGAALDRVCDGLAAEPDLALATTLAAVGHRVVHGGARFAGPVRVDAAVAAAIADLAPLAPAHNPVNGLGIACAQRWFPGVPQVAVFDTAFHQTLPEHAWRYPVPAAAVATPAGTPLRRYGFHGISHASAARRAAAFLGRPLAQLKLITLHLGNGASAAAIDAGRCIDTSMGYTPLEGLMMGSRSGDLDPAVPLLMLADGRDGAAVRSLLERESGLKAVCGASDMRTVRERAAAGDAAAALARTMFCYRVKKTIGAYFAALGGADAIVFTGGIGAHDAELRAQCCAGLEALGIALDPPRAETTGDTIALHTARRGAVAVLALVADEEAEVARQTRECLGLG